MVYIRNYALKNKQWLDEKSKEEGVVALSGGVCYKVLAQGKNNGIHPTAESTVTAHYTGRTIDGQEFDSSRGGAPLTLRLCDLIDGWTVALQQMCVGDRWEVYIPSELGYGKDDQLGIKGGSTLIFDIELLEIN